MSYDQFIDTKRKTHKPCGFDPDPFIVPLFDWQKVIVSWAVRLGRAALFEDCGLGKTAQQLEWASQVFRKTGKSVLILTPLAVAEQTVSEASKFGVPCSLVESEDEIRTAGVYVTNYEKLDAFSSHEFAGVVLDESSIPQIRFR